MLKCPTCKSILERSDDCYRCSGCNSEYLIQGGINIILPEINERERERDEYFFPEEGFKKLFEAEESNFWFRARNKIIYNFLQSCTCTNDKIIEIGCGTGYVAGFIKSKGYNIDCADLFESALKYCKKRNSGINYYCYNLYNNIFCDEYDVVCAFDVIEHLEDDKLVLDNIRESLKDSGKLILTVPACEKYWSSVDEHAGHKRRYEKAELIKKLEGSGFKVQRMSYFMFTLLPFYSLSRKQVKRNDNTANKSNKESIGSTVDYELNPPKIVNECLYYALKLETIMLKYINMPLGSSIICVAEKEN